MEWEAIWIIQAASIAQRKWENIGRTEMVFLLVHWTISPLDWEVFVENEAQIHFDHVTKTSQ